MNEKLAAALVQAQKAARAVEKGSTNSFHKYNYASAEAIITEAKAALAEAGLALVRADVERGEYAGPGDIKQQEMIVSYVLYHECGENQQFVSRGTVVVERGRTVDKAENTALTNMLAYFLRDLLLLPRVPPGTETDAREDREEHHEPSRPNGYDAPPGPPELISKEQVKQLEDLLKLHAANREKFLAAYRLGDVSDMEASSFHFAVEDIKKLPLRKPAKV